MLLVSLCLTSLGVSDSPSFLAAGRGATPPSSWLSGASPCASAPSCVPSPVLTHLGFIRVLAVAQGAAMNTGIPLSFKTMVFSGSVPRSGAAGPMALVCLVFHGPLSCSPSWIS